MSLRTRLWLVVGALVLIPLVAAGVLVGWLGPQAAANETRERLTTSAASVRAALADRCQAAGLTARAMAAEAAVSTPAAATAAARSASVDYTALLRSDGSVIASAGTLPGSISSPGALVPCSGEGDPGGVLAERVALDIGTSPELAAAVVVVAVDRQVVQSLAERLALTGGDSVTLLSRGGALVATTAAPAEAAALAGAVAEGSPGSQIDVDGWRAAVAPPVTGVPWTIVVSTEEPGGDIVRSMLPILLGLTLVTGILGLVIARGLTRPLSQLSQAAERVAKGDLQHQVGVESADEVGRVSAALNRMSGQLRTQQARAGLEVREGLARMGEALQNTHDVDRLLRVVLNAAVVSTGARAGLAMVSDGTGLFVLAAEQSMEEHGLPVPPRVTQGHGVIGTVAGTGVGLRGRLGESGDLPPPVAEEPDVGEVLIMPLRRGARIVGVLALYDRRDGLPFGAEEEKGLRTLADQAGIAVDNIRLHKEAERLSMTDPLTGLRNFRYLSSELAREIERASRFERPLAVLMLDLDHFKSINDTYGHARGDAVLRELASRVSEQIREVDTLARYGGEEFVIVLPETTAEGAGMLADRVCAAVRRQKFTSDGDEPLTVTLSIGAASFPIHGGSAATLMRAADEALYVAKRAGRDRWHLAGSPPGAEDTGGASDTGAPPASG